MRLVIARLMPLVLSIPFIALATTEMAAADATVAQAVIAQAKKGIPMKSAKRRVPEPEPVVHNGVRYEVEFGGKRRGFPHRGGVIAAVDEATGQVRWTVVVYRVTFNPNKEEDAQEVFITDLALSDDRRHLLVTNEENRRFSVDLTSHAVEPAR
jgi:hypothetical protein